MKSLLKFTLYIILMVWLSMACTSEKDAESPVIPPCLEERIAELQQEDCPSVGKVYRYRFQGSTVYVIHPRTCGADLTSAIVDTECNTLCHLGGITGNQECDGVNFMDNATDEVLVYP